MKGFISIKLSLEIPDLDKVNSFLNPTTIWAYFYYYAFHTSLCVTCVLLDRSSTPTEITFFITVFPAPNNVYLAHLKCSINVYFIELP